MPFLGLDFSVGELTCSILNICSEADGSKETSRYYEHNHSCLELHYVEAGSCDYICDKKIYPMRAGRGILIPLRMYHQETGTSNDFKKLSILFEIAEPLKAANSADARFRSAFFSDHPIVLPIDNAALTHALSYIRTLLPLAENDYISFERLRAVCNLFLVELFAQITGNAVVKTEKGTKGGISQEYVIDNFLALQFTPKASVSELAEQLHVSERQLYRMITKKYGMNFRDKMKEIRVEIATNFLLNTNKSITQIAELMGYNSLSAFSTFIKNTTGNTPNEIRKGKTPERSVE